MINICNQHFIFSAAHAFEAYGKSEILVGGQNILHSLTGNRYSTIRGPSGTHQDDSIDAAVFHIKGDVSPEIQSSSLKWDDLDLEEPLKNLCFHVALGFRAKRTKYQGRQAETILEEYVFAEYGKSEYDANNIKKSHFIALAWNDTVFMDNMWKRAPSPKGMSGGAILKINNVSIDPTIPVQKPKAKLSGITIERRNKNSLPAAFIGTRIGAHLGLIYQFVPEIKIWMDKQFELNESNRPV